MHSRKYLWALSVAILFYAGAPNDAAAAECQSPDDAGSFEVNVKVDVGQPTIYNHRTRAQLSGASSVHGRRRNILGTMQGNVDLRWFINYKVNEVSNGTCFWVASADVELSYHQLDVNIAAEYEPGSCQYEAILEHEFEHVAVAQQIMSPYAQQIEQALTTLSIPTPDLPSIADSPAQARAEVQEVFRRVLLPVRDQMNQLVRARQADVDTPENYRWTFKKCRRW
ncbi:MAG: hypothetical protein HKN28_00350 [Alphaproteobacteria bacterium]|nr:hypothetical protein [Alphaproteobacteria bacterium]